MSINAMKSYEQYLETYSGQELLKKHSLSTTGYWKIKGEDPNCDFGGHHYQPDLGTVEGTLRDIIMYAVTLPGFWAWGAGGDFVYMGAAIPHIDSSSYLIRQELEEEASKLEARLKEIKDTLKRK